MTTFFRNLFGGTTAKITKSTREESRIEANQDVEVPAITADRRLSLSKSGKMKRKSYSRQVSVADKKFFEDPETIQRNNNYNSQNSDQQQQQQNEEETIDDVVKEMLETVESTKL